MQKWVFCNVRNMSIWPCHETMPPLQATFFQFSVMLLPDNPRRTLATQDRWLRRTGIALGRFDGWHRRVTAVLFFRNIYQSESHSSRCVAVGGWHRRAGGWHRANGTVGGTGSGIAPDQASGGGEASGRWHRVRQRTISMSVFGGWYRGHRNGDVSAEQCGIWATCSVCA